ncbi:MAG: SDR family oxidoreductase [Filimonas sp.]|nr:SDR family oxidoreductase [Filimonas sp.]
MNLSLTGKNALVCGASQGLGAAVAHELALLGASVIVLARNEEKLKTIVATLDTTQHQQHGYIVADTTDPEGVQEKVNAYLEKGNTIHILVNNSGGPASGPLIETSVDDLRTAFNAHLVTSHLLAQAVITGMRNAQYGRIINIVSTSIKEPIRGLGISNTIRAAVANWAKTLATEVGNNGITVNNVLPGFTKTDRLGYLFGKQAEAANTSIEEIEKRSAALIPAGRLGEPSEFGAAVAFLCSPAAAYINGINLPVDGGRLQGL